MNQSVINLSSIDVFSLCISSRLINKRRVKSSLCMLRCIPALLDLDKQSDTSLYCERFMKEPQRGREGEREACAEMC